MGFNLFVERGYIALRKLHGRKQNFKKVLRHDASDAKQYARRCAVSNLYPSHSPDSLPDCRDEQDVGRVLRVREKRVPKWRTIPELNTPPVCNYCGKEMTHNVPRCLGDCGWVHKHSGTFDCDADAVPTSRDTPAYLSSAEMEWTKPRDREINDKMEDGRSRT
jgi:hypothetical protein